MYWAHERGDKAEQRVCEEMQRRGYRLVRRRLHTPYAEVDLVMASLAEYLLIEVKTIGHPAFLQNRIGRAQKARLERAREYLEAKTRAPVRLLWAFVSSEGRILLLNGGDTA